MSFSLQYPLQLACISIGLQRLEKQGLKSINSSLMRNSYTCTDGTGGGSDAGTSVSAQLVYMRDSSPPTTWLINVELN